MSSIACGALVFEDSGAAITKEEQKCKTAKINVRDCSLVELVFDVAKNTQKLIFGYIAPRPMFYYQKEGSTPNSTTNAYF